MLTSMKLYVCWYTGTTGGQHPCGVAYHALVDAGYEPEVVKARGWRLLPNALNNSKERLEVEKLTGKRTVPVLVTDSGEVVGDSKAIIAWAKAHPAQASAAK